MGLTVTQRRVAIALLVGGGGTMVYQWQASKAARARQRQVRKIASQECFSKRVEATKKKKERVAVDARFVRRIRVLLKIIIPGPLSPEAGYLGLVAGMLVARTYSDIWHINNGTSIERAIISRDREGFVRYLTQFLMSMPPIAIVNNLLKYGLYELAIRFRARLTKHLMQQYMQGFTYYKVSNMDNRIQNVDQLLTTDIEKFSQSVADLYSNLSKPILDIGLYAYYLASQIGGMGPVKMIGYLVGSGVFLTWMRRPVGRQTVTEQALEGEYRFVNSRLIQFAEEIAFYGGNAFEEATVRDTWRRLERQLRWSQQFRASIGIIDTVVAKYLAMAVGYWVVSTPFLNLEEPRFLEATREEMMEDYYRSGRMLLKMAEAIGRLVLAGRELTRLAGFTARVTELRKVLSEVSAGKYQELVLRDIVSGKVLGGPGFVEGDSAPGATPPLKLNSGRILELDRTIKFEKVPVVTPTGDVLVRELSFEVKSGHNVLVAGPNGCGKSSLFRILGELWPMYGGTISKPAQSKLFYVPQKPYLALGTLRDQIIYPSTHAEVKRKGISDARIQDYLVQVQLGYLSDRDGGFDAVQDWADVLSGGEKQRVAMARLFFHRPQFAILDECTSAVSVDVEGFMYANARDLGITLFTVSHRKSLWKFHEYVLAFDGRGGYKFDMIDQQDSGSHFGS